MFLTIPTIMTWARIAAIPLIVGVFYLPLPAYERNLIATVLFVVFAATDWLDGYLARIDSLLQSRFALDMDRAGIEFFKVDLAQPAGFVLDSNLKVQSDSVGKNFANWCEIGRAHV